MDDSIGVSVPAIGNESACLVCPRKIDLTGSSTGWHRAELIDSALRHFNEWWLVGQHIPGIGCRPG